MTLDRRAFLGGAALFMAAPRVVFAQAATDRRFIFIIQRGAADGLDTVIPYADPGYARARGAIALDTGAAHKLDGTFALHPELTGLSRLYAAGQASFFHAVASPYRDRSHFDAQNVLETGGRTPSSLRDGWINRLVGLLPHIERPAMAFAPAVPLALQGAAKVTSYAPSNLPRAQDDLLMRVEALYEKDALLHAVWSAAMQAREMAGGRREGGGRQDAAAMGRMAAGFLARADGPRLAMIETNGWDTHSGQTGRLAGQLRSLDGLIAGLQEGLGAAWAQTVVLVATEFGRTVRANGTSGTDHGTGAVAMLMGGAVQGGRVVADWPGLAPSQLFEGRDIRPTLALDALMTATCAQCFDLEPQRVARTLFPEGARGSALPRLLRG